jgi:Spy/CpxP family protein refolding chaperone
MTESESTPKPDTNYRIDVSDLVHLRKANSRGSSFRDLLHVPLDIAGTFTPFTRTFAPGRAFKLSQLVRAEALGVHNIKNIEIDGEMINVRLDNGSINPDITREQINLVMNELERRNEEAAKVAQLRARVIKTLTLGACGSIIGITVTGSGVILSSMALLKTGATIALAPTLLGMGASLSITREIDRTTSEKSPPVEATTSTRQRLKDKLTQVTGGLIRQMRTSLQSIREKLPRRQADQAAEAQVQEETVREEVTESQEEPSWSDRNNGVLLDDYQNLRKDWNNATATEIFKGELTALKEHILAKEDSGKTLSDDLESAFKSVAVKTLGIKLAVIGGYGNIETANAPEELNILKARFAILIAQVRQELKYNRAPMKYFNAWLGKEIREAAREGKVLEVHTLHETSTRNPIRANPSPLEATEPDRTSTPEQDGFVTKLNTLGPFNTSQPAAPNAETLIAPAGERITLEDLPHHDSRYVSLTEHTSSEYPSLLETRAFLNNFAENLFETNLRFNDLALRIGDLTSDIKKVLCGNRTLSRRDLRDLTKALDTTIKEAAQLYNNQVPDQKISTRKLRSTFLPRKHRAKVRRVRLHSLISPLSDRRSLGLSLILRNALRALLGISY